MSPARRATPSPEPAREAEGVFDYDEYSNHAVRTAARHQSQAQRDGSHVRPAQGREQAGLHRIPAVWLPEPRHLTRRAQDHGRARRRRGRDRPAVLRPGDGRPRHPGGQPDRPEQRGKHQRRVQGGRDGGQRRRRATHHELLEPDLPLRRRTVRLRFRERRRCRPDYPRPHPR